MVTIRLLANQVGITATDTLDLGQGVHDLLLSIDVRVQQTDDVLEAGRRQHCGSVFSKMQHKSPAAHSQQDTLISTLSSSLEHAGPPHITALTTWPGVVSPDSIDDRPSMLSDLRRRLYRACGFSPGEMSMLNCGEFDGIFGDAAGCGEWQYVLGLLS
jgi:hypothetical protein